MPTTMDDRMMTGKATRIEPRLDPSQDKDPNVAPSASTPLPGASRWSDMSGRNSNAMLAQLMAGRGAAGAPPGGRGGGGFLGGRGGERGGDRSTAAPAAQREGNGGASPDPGDPLAKEAATEIAFGDKAFAYDPATEAFLFAAHHAPSSSRSDGNAPHWSEPTVVRETAEVVVPLAPCVYRMTDYTYGKKEPVRLDRCLGKLGVLRCLARECDALNRLLKSRFAPDSKDAGLPTALPLLESIDAPSRKGPAIAQGTATGVLEEDELGKTRFMELLSNCGVYQKVSDLILEQCSRVVVGGGPPLVPQVRVDGLDDFLRSIEDLVPALQQARDEIGSTATVSFFPGLGEHFTPGSKLTCFPSGMEGTPLGCQVVQCWYDQPETSNGSGPPTKGKRRFILVLEFVVSVGDKLVFVAASDVYPEFVDPTRNVPIRDLTHRKLDEGRESDRVLLRRLQQRGEFYASVATRNHYLEYHPNSFFPIIGGGWSNNAIRPLSKGGRVMVDSQRGILEGHMPVRATSDGMSDSVKEAIKLYQQSKRTGVAVPFRTCVVPGLNSGIGLDPHARQPSGDMCSLWQAWPMVTGFSFTARVWGKLLLGMPKVSPVTGEPLDGSTHHKDGLEVSPRRAAVQKLGVMAAGLGGAGCCGNCGYIHFQEKAFDQLVLADDKKELIRAVARNAGGGPKFSDDDDEWGEEEDEDEDDDAGIDVVANKGSASIFLLHGPPGCGKTLTAEAIAELLRKPLYVVTAGDLGTDAAQVEKSLGSVLELCQTWDALVLIDEADIFLEARSSHEIHRNALVCVMLRLLEYYSGCLFLSSNRAAKSVDPAIASRITVMLGYPPLDHAGRCKVWKNLVELVPVVPPGHKSSPRKASKYRVNFEDADYATLASDFKLNGRQIKNSIVLARALARERGSSLSMDILRRAVVAVVGEDTRSD